MTCLVLYLRNKAPHAEATKHVYMGCRLGLDLLVICEGKGLKLGRQARLMREQEGERRVG